MANRFWIGNGGNWTDTAHWSATSGGSGGASVPTGSDDAYFDANSFSSAAQTVTVPSGATYNCRSLIWTGATNSPTFALNGGLWLFGSLTLIAGMSMTLNGGVLEFKNNLTTSITTGGATITGNSGAIIIANQDGGTYNLQDDFAIGGVFFVLNTGTLNTNNHDIQAAGIYLADNGIGTVANLGTSTATVREWWVDGSNTTVDADQATIVVTGGNGYYFVDTIGVTYGAIQLGTAIGTAPANFNMYGNITVGDLTIYSSSTAGSAVFFVDGPTLTVTGALSLEASTTYPLRLRSDVPGSPFTLSKSSGVLRFDYLNLRDSRATGGATWFAGANSTDSGNNTGWVFGIPTFNSSIAGTVTLGSDLDPTALHYSSISGTIELEGSATAERVITPVAGKEYVYRVYQADGTYIGIWNDVASELTFSQRLNTPGATTSVRLARSASRTIEARENLTDQTGDPLTDETGDNLVAVFQTSNTVGEDTDVDLNYNVDVYVHYGGFENLLTEDGEEILAEDGDFLIVAIGAPLGARVFSGFIVDYSAGYGAQDYVEVSLASHGFELSQEVVKDGSNTTRTYSTTAHDAIIKSVLDTNPGTMSYSTESIAATGETITQVFRLNTKLEAIESVYNQSPAGWYWYGNVADNNVYFKEKSATADHTLVLGKHIKSIEVKRSIEDLRNTIYFVGGDTGGGTILYKKYEDAASITAWRQGLHRITDRRFTLAASAEKYADKILDRFAGPVYTTTVTLLAGAFNIEEIILGQVVGFAGFGNFVDDLLLQIVARNYEPHTVTLELGELLPRQQDLIQENVEDLQGEQYTDIPNAPS